MSSDAIPAPRNVQYSASDGVVRWSPPSIEPALENSNISIAFGITHYNIYVTDERTGLLIANFTTTDLQTRIATVAEVPCSVSIQVSAVNQAGEGQRSRFITESRKSIHI